MAKRYFFIFYFKRRVWFSIVRRRHQKVRVEAVERDCACVRTERERKRRATKNNKMINERRFKTSQGPKSGSGATALVFCAQQMRKRKRKNETLISFVNCGRRPVASEKKKKPTTAAANLQPITIFITIAHSINRSHICPTWGPGVFLFNSRKKNKKKNL